VLGPYIKRFGCGGRRSFKTTFRFAAERTPSAVVGGAERSGWLRLCSNPDRLLTTGGDQASGSSRFDPLTWEVRVRHSRAEPSLHATWGQGVNLDREGRRRHEASRLALTNPIHESGSHANLGVDREFFLRASVPPKPAGDFPRLASLAQAGEVLVSGTVKDLVAGSGIEFEPRGVRELKGVGERPLYAVVAA
jgi:hypothetical protein